MSPRLWAHDGVYHITPIWITGADNRHAVLTHVAVHD